MESLDRIITIDRVYRPYVDFIGKGTIKTSLFSKRDIFIRIPKTEKFLDKKFKLMKNLKLPSKTKMNSKRFLRTINKYLEREQMYIYNVKYTSASWKNIYRHNLIGDFYKYNEKMDRLLSF